MLCNMTLETGDELKIDWSDKKGRRGKFPEEREQGWYRCYKDKNRGLCFLNDFIFSFLSDKEDFEL